MVQIRNILYISKTVANFILIIASFKHSTHCRLKI